MLEKRLKNKRDRSESFTYLEPELVLTTLPEIAPLGTGEVVTVCPSLKLGDPVILPVIEPSSFCFQFSIVGTPG